MAAETDNEIEIVATLEKQQTSPMFVRVASLFKEDQPEWRCCCCTIVKKTAVETIGKFVLFVGMISYIFYQLGKYFDSNENREEYVDIRVVDTMPMPFIYVDMYLGNMTYCQFDFAFWNGTEYTYTTFDEYENWGNDPNEVDIQDLFDYVDNDNDCKGVWIKYDYEYVLCDATCIAFVIIIYIMFCQLQFCFRIHFCSVDNSQFV